MAIRRRCFRMRIRVFCLLVSALWLAACENRNYETGDGSLSYMRADFGEMTTEAGNIGFVVTDDGDTLRFGSISAPSWAQRVDSTYRVLVYYNDYHGKLPQLLQAAYVPAVDYMMAYRVQAMATDPVGLERVWKSRNGKYLNLGLLLKTGQQDTLDTRQTLGVVCDSVALRPDGTRKFFLRLYHDQSGVPEYYTSRTFLSLNIAAMESGDEYQLTVNTYDGVVVKNL